MNWFQSISSFFTKNRVSRSASPEPIAPTTQVVVPPNTSYSQFVNRMTPTLVSRVNSLQNPITICPATFEAFKTPESSLLHLRFQFNATTSVQFTFYVLSQQTVNLESTQLQFQSVRAFTPWTVDYPKGKQQTLVTTSSECLNLESLPITALIYQKGASIFPIILKVTLEEDEVLKNQYLYLTVQEPCKVGSHDEVIWPLQILQHKIEYEHKILTVQKVYGMDTEDTTENLCVICIMTPKSTAVLPCRHLCLCSMCANLFRIRVDTCPICRAVITGFLHISNTQKKEK